MSGRLDWRYREHDEPVVEKEEEREEPEQD
jgi:hypothetical protein